MLGSKKTLVLVAALLLLWRRWPQLRRWLSSYLLARKTRKKLQWTRELHGGNVVAEVLKAHNVETIFTLTGGHIAPILVGCKQAKIRVIDVRHEVSAAFAADAYSRVKGGVGVAVVTAGPGLTNTITAVKNAQLAQSPMVLLGGATSDILKGRGSLQDIDQFALLQPHCKWMAHISSISDLASVVEEAFYRAREGVPGVCFVEFPLDTLYRKATILELYEKEKPKGKGLVNAIIRWYIGRHVNSLLSGSDSITFHEPMVASVLRPSSSQISKVLHAFQKAKHPVMLLGAQAMINPSDCDALIAAVEHLSIPVWISSNARGLLGVRHPLQYRHARALALKKADLVILVGVVMDFRLGYGLSIPRTSKLVSFNLSKEDLYKNRTPDIAVLADPALCLVALSKAAGVFNKSRFDDWHRELRVNEDAREREIDEAAVKPVAPGFLNTVRVCRAIDAAMSDNALVVADGGDFVGTAAYNMWPRGPRTWLDPGVFGTLGVGGGFAVGAAAALSEGHTGTPREVWILWGDGASGFSLSELDTMVRHGLSVIAVVGNDAAWMQILRDQVELLDDDVGSILSYTDYHKVAEGFGAKGILINSHDDLDAKLRQAKELSAQGHPVLVNCMLARSDFRRGSISM